jgi:DUF971 family protein
MTGEPWPVELRLQREERLLLVRFEDGASFSLPAEYLRVESPSAEVQGHGAGPKTLVSGKRQVGIETVEPIGNYAVKLHFDDRHDTGIFTWTYLYQLGQEQAERWAAYEQELVEAQVSRDPAPRRGFGLSGFGGPTSAISGS